MITEKHEPAAAATTPKRNRHWIRNVLIGLAILIVLFLIVVYFQPDTFRITRSASIAAPPPVVFAQLNDFHNWQAWSPWAKLDPSAKNTFGGSPAGQGATFAWEGNDKVGAGQMTILESHPHDLIRLQLDFIKPFPSTAITEFTLQPSADYTLLTWTMSGKKNFMSKAFCMFMNMDKMVGGDFEKGLASLKSISESAPTPAPTH